MTYSSSLLAGRQRFAGKNQNSVNLSQQKKQIGPVSNTIILIVLTCILGLVYLTQVTKTKAFSYEINSLQKQQSSLKEEQDTLAIEAARLQSLDEIKNSTVASSLVPITPTVTIQN